MRRVNLLLLGGMIMFLTLCAIAQAGMVYQDFEPGNGSSQYGWGYGYTHMALTSGDDPVRPAARARRCIADVSATISCLIRLMINSGSAL